MRVSEAYKAFQVLSDATTNGVAPSEVVNIIKIMGALRPISVEFENFRKDLFEKFGIVNFENTVNALRMGAKLTDEQRHELEVYETQVDSLLNEELNREIEKLPEFPRISHETMAALIQSNGWKMGASVEFSFLIV